MTQLFLILGFTFFEDQANAFYAIMDYSLFYGSSLILSFVLAVYLMLQLLRRGLLKRVGAKSRRVSESKGYR